MTPQVKIFYRHSHPALDPTKRGHRITICGRVVGDTLTFGIIYWDRNKRKRGETKRNSKKGCKEIARLRAETNPYYSVEVTTQGDDLVSTKKVLQIQIQNGQNPQRVFEEECKNIINFHILGTAKEEDFKSLVNNKKSLLLKSKELLDLKLKELENVERRIKSFFFKKPQDVNVA